MTALDRFHADFCGIYGAPVHAVLKPQGVTSQQGSAELKAGTYNGSEKARSYLKFNACKYAGK